jgi:hypothetical protein
VCVKLDAFIRTDHAIQRGVQELEQQPWQAGIITFKQFSIMRDRAKFQKGIACFGKQVDCFFGQRQSLVGQAAEWTWGEGGYHDSGLLFPEDTPICGTSCYSIIGYHARA